MWPDPTRVSWQVGEKTWERGWRCTMRMAIRPGFKTVSWQNMQCMLNKILLITCKIILKYAEIEQAKKRICWQGDGGRRSRNLLHYWLFAITWEGGHVGWQNKMHVMLLPLGWSVVYTFNHARQKWQGLVADPDIEIGGGRSGKGSVRKTIFWTMWQFDLEIRGASTISTTGYLALFSLVCRFMVSTVRVTGLP